jgi:hypothetical protein
LAFDHQEIGEIQSASSDSDPDLARTGLWDGQIDKAGRHASGLKVKGTHAGLLIFSRFKARDRQKVKQPPADSGAKR